ncbi:NADP-dependent 3-hydroxy acid dehydrogenase YdfG [Saccharopolyspora kobensis]|uniref:NADP-dependent 3-hydroxy acid dehydrogenase YdfG n=1 Tax=Saccharopolyspora kobensis TaxID=146035 RepID=A0A1H5UDH0_9PSEU|nr:SDR family oxidoreductase [Saccharopolyspora kobensis]SEF73153.1 NADP-dependent 3-hydroxy acid dehydrogenase YdfG [Saccharopolyspora kobensis]SFC74608.1 NADP-dependent 3-hydroxy acid dehydrogenase YdfG [Saccharopolyspora kobensis]
MHDARTAIVTGAGSGIGYATAVALAAEGYRIVAVDIAADGTERAADAVAAAGSEALPVALDVRDADAFEAAVDRAEQHFGGAPELLANIAGIGVAATLTETSREDWDAVLGVNLTALFETCRIVLPRMVAAGGGCIVNVSSVAGVVGVRNRAAYCASKAGVIGLTRSIAVDYADRGIRANAICPGTVASEWIGKILADAPDPGAAREAMEKRQLDGRMGTPEEVAEGIVFLAGARFANGSAFVMDGGMTAI